MTNRKSRNKWDRKKQPPRRERRPEDRHAHAKLSELIPPEQRRALEKLRRELNE